MLGGAGCIRNPSSSSRCRIGEAGRLSGPGDGSSTLRPLRDTVARSTKAETPRRHRLPKGGSSFSLYSPITLDRREGTTEMVSNEGNSSVIGTTATLLLVGGLPANRLT